MSRTDAVAEILGDWYARGEVESPEEVVRAHPELASALRDAFAAHDLLARARPPAPSSSSSPAGTRVVGDFRLLREVGRGGMGVVYEAEQLSLGRRVALKVLDPALGLSARGVERFRREAQAAGRLRHPHLVPVFAFGEQDGVWYYAMEWLPGTSLAQRIEERRAGPAGPVDHAALAAPLAGVADALAAAHAAGVTHRDVKPANLVFDAAGTLKITDFGLALVAGDPSRTAAGDLLGTPAYMSPEQTRGGGARVDGRSDVYSLGATLYELLTLRPPFEGADAAAICAQVLTQDPPPPRRLRPEIPRELETIVLTAMAREPEHRYASAGALADDLRAFAEGRPLRARPPGLLARVRRRLRGRTAAALLGGLAGVLAVVGGGLALRASAPAAGPSTGPGDGPGDGPGGTGPVDGAGAADAASGLPGGPDAGSPWSVLPQIPVATYGLAAVIHDGRLWAVSGYHSPRVALYDPRQGAWSAGVPLPEALQYFGLAVLDGAVFVVGGDRGGTGASADLLRLDPASGRWERRAPMPGGPRYDVGAAVLDGRLWVVGGLDATGRANLARVEVYDPRTDRWEDAPPLPEPRALGGGLAALDGRLYAAGGSVGGAWVTTLAAYDPAARAWTARAPLPRPAAAQAAVVDGRLLLVGGGPVVSSRRVCAYDPRADAWTEEPPLHWARRAHGVAYDPAERRLYAVAGYLESGLFSVEAWTPPAPGAASDAAAR